MRAFRDLSDDELLAAYAYPTQLRRPWVRVNFITSLDGAAWVSGSSGSLGTAADKRVFGLLRGLADVVLVGAGTVRAEDYGGVKLSAAVRERRAAAGQAPVPPVGVITKSGRLDPNSRIYTDTSVPPILLGVGGGGGPAELLAELASLGLTRVLCEGGPGVFGSLIAADAVDELCLTVSPMLVGGVAPRIGVTGDEMLTRMAPASVLLDDEGALMTRWIRG